VETEENPSRMRPERNDFVIGTNQGKANVIFVKKTDQFVTIVN